MALYNLGLNYVYTSYNSIILPKQLELLFPQDLKGLVLGAIVFLCTVVGVTTNVFSGVLSDSNRLRWGRRWPYILIGAVLTSIVLLLPAVLPVAIITIFSSYLMMQIFTDLSAGSYQPLLPDIIVEDQRGAASGLQGLMTLLGAAAGFGLTGYFVGSGLSGYALISMSTTFLLTTVVTIRTVRSSDRFAREPRTMGARQAFREILRPRTFVASFFWLVIGSFLIFMGSSGLMFFEVYYFEAVLGIPNPYFAVAIAGLVILLVAMISSVLFGFLSDRVGRRNLIIGAAMVAGAATFVVPFLTNFSAFLVVASLLGASLGIFNSISFALASDLAPKDETGKYMAYSNLAVGGANAIAPLIDGVLLFLFGASTMSGFVALFSLSGAFYFVGAVVLFKVPSKAVHADLVLQGQED